MAKSLKEKLMNAIASAVKLRDEAVVGEQEGQYSHESIHALNTGIEFAIPVSESEDSTEESKSEALSVIGEAIKAFKSSVIKPKPPEKSEEEEKVVSLKGVVLRDWGNRKGIHQIHLGHTIVAFIDGKANLSADMADELKKAGYVE